MSAKQNMLIQPSLHHGRGVVSADEALPVRAISTYDLQEAVANGWEDFKAKPSHLVMLAVIYPLAGVFLAQLTVSYDVFPLLFPLMAGFALIGPLAALIMK